MKRAQKPFRALSQLLLAMALVATGGSAVAQTEPVPVAAAGLRTTPIGRMRVSLSVVPAPLGSFEGSLPIIGDYSLDTAFAFGLRPAFDFSINDYFFVGFSPQLLLNVKGEDDDGDDADAAKALDLLLRVGVHAPVAEKIHLYGFLSPGYSIIYPTAGDQDPAGFVLGVTAGGMYSFTDRLFASADIGYQVGFQEYSALGADWKYHLRYLLIGLGVGMRL
jgi:hypothetical protein